MIAGQRGHGDDVAAVQQHERSTQRRATLYRHPWTGD